jgi:hypothetical protein
VTSHRLDLQRDQGAFSMLPLKFMLFSGGPSASVPVAALFHTSASPNLCNRSQRVSIDLDKTAPRARGGYHG